MEGLNQLCHEHQHGSYPAAKKVPTVETAVFEDSRGMAARKGTRASLRCEHEVQLWESAMSRLVRETMRSAQFYKRNSKIRKKTQNGAWIKDLFGKRELKDG